MTISKKDLRKDFLNKRLQLSCEQAGRESQKIHQQLYQFISQKPVRFSQLFGFVPYNNEPDISSLYRELEDNFVFGLPRIVGKHINYHLWQPGDQLVLNQYGIAEPESTQPILVPNNQTIMVIPGIAFDKRGYRLGYGGGYFDRYLSNHQMATSIGISFDDFVVDQLPHEPHDRKVDYICSQNRVMRIK